MGARAHPVVGVGFVMVVVAQEAQVLEVAAVVMRQQMVVVVVECNLSQSLLPCLC